MMSPPNGNTLANSILRTPPGEVLDACPLCLTRDSIIVGRQGVLYSSLKERATVVSNLCLSCGVIYNNPRLSREMLIRFYQTEQAARRSAVSIAQLMNAPESSKTKRRVEFVLPFLRPNVRLLEVGCGACNTIAAFARRLVSGQMTGLEPSLGCDSRPLPNLSLIAGRIDETSIPEALQLPYDCVSVFHVLEHQHDPLGFLRQLRKTLLIDGLLYLEVPNTYRPFKKDVEAYFKTVHLFSYGKRSLEFLLRNAGFVPLAWDEGECKVLRVVSKAAAGAGQVKPQPLQALEVTTIKRYFFGWKLYSICHRASLLNRLAPSLSSLAWRRLRPSLLPL